MRLELSKRTDFALRAIRILDQNRPNLVKGSKLANELGTTAYFLPHVMKPLVGQGWVESLPGPTGGYRAVVRPADVSLLDLIDAVEGLSADTCVLRGGPCGDDPRCAVHEAWEPARKALFSHLAATSLQEPSRANTEDR